MKLKNEGEKIGRGTQAIRIFKMTGAIVFVCLGKKMQEAERSTKGLQLKLILKYYETESRVNHNPLGLSVRLRSLKFNIIVRKLRLAIGAERRNKIKISVVVLRSGDLGFK